MFNEYDLNDLERRLTKLEKRVEKASFCHFLEQKEGKSAQKTQTFDFEFIAQTKTYLKIYCSIELKAEHLFKLNLLLNEAFVNEWQFSSNKGVIEFLLPVIEGVNKVSVICESDELIEVNSCTLETFGNICYKAEDYQLLHLADEDKTLVIFYENGRASLKKYQNGVFSFIKEWENLKSIAICKLKENYLIAYANDIGEGIVELYNTNFTMAESGVIDSSISSICAISGEVATVFAIKGNMVYKYTLSSCSTFEKTKTQFRGKKVQSNPQISGCIIISDHNGFARLVTV